jgi:hypothetical protein
MKRIRIGIATRFSHLKQSLEDYPEIGGCRIDSGLVDKLYSR